MYIYIYIYTLEIGWWRLSRIVAERKTVADTSIEPPRLPCRIASSWSSWS